MYRVNKETGTSENVYLQNTGTMAEINLGRITPALIRILEIDGYKFEGLADTDDVVTLTLKEKWTLKVSEEVKEQLRKLAMPMKKPVRDQRKNKEKDLYPNVKTTKQPVDILDIIYGLN